MRDIFYNQTHKIDPKEWLVTLNESELAEWNWIQSNIEKVNKRTDEFDLKEPWYLGRVLYALSLGFIKMAAGINTQYPNIKMIGASFTD